MMAMTDFVKDLIDALNGKEVEGVDPRARDVVDAILNGEEHEAESILNAVFGTKVKPWLCVDPETGEVYLKLGGDEFWAKLLLFLWDGGRWMSKIGRCLHCGRYFAKRKAKQRFCSHRCRYAWRDSRRAIKPHLEVGG